MTLHHAIHFKLDDVPVPSGKACKMAYEEILRRERAGIISLEDSPLKKLDFLIEMFQSSSLATTVMLLWQKQIIEKYYNNVP